MVVAKSRNMLRYCKLMIRSAVLRYQLTIKLVKLCKNFRNVEVNTNRSLDPADPADPAGPGLCPKHPQ